MSLLDHAQRLKTISHLGLTYSLSEYDAAFPASHFWGYGDARSARRVDAASDRIGPV